MTPVFRFAPSPNGDLHLGHALSALLNFEMAKATGGRLLLRIEDIDPARCRPEFEAGIYQDLRWLGLDWEEPVRRQSEHADYYREALEDLKTRGLVYPAFLSRAEVRSRVAAFETGGEMWPRDPDGTPFYPVEERSLDPPEIAARRIAAGDRHMWRLDVQRAMIFAASVLPPPSGLPANSPALGEAIAYRKDSSPTDEAEPLVSTRPSDFNEREGFSSQRPPLLEARHFRESSPPLWGRWPAGQKGSFFTGDSLAPVGEIGRPEAGNATHQPSLTWTETGSGSAQFISADPSIWGDVVLWRWDAPSSYHLSVVLDDALQGVTHVVRGRDLYHATPMHRLLQILFGLPQPVYHHHSLLLDETGEKLSKSLGSTGLRALRDSGLTPSDIRRRIGLDRLLA